MSKLAWVIVLTYVLLLPGVAAFVWCKRNKGGSASITVSVKAACTTIIVLAAINGLDGGPSYLTLIAAGIVLGLVGDVTICAKDGFLFGMIWFALGHIAYIASLVQITAHPLWAVPVFVALYGAVFAVVFGLRKKAGNLFVPVLVYAAVIAAMVSLAASSVTTHGGPLLLAAAALFALSDSLLGVGKIVKELNLGQELLCEYSYFIAQSLFSFSIYIL